MDEYETLMVLWEAGSSALSDVYSKMRILYNSHSRSVFLGKGARVESG